MKVHLPPVNLHLVCNYRANQQLTGAKLPFVVVLSHLAIFLALWSP